MWSKIVGHKTRIPKVESCSIIHLNREAFKRIFDIEKLGLEGKIYAQSSQSPAQHLLSSQMSHTESI